MTSKDIKDFFVGAYNGISIYIGDTIIWPICKLLNWVDQEFRSIIANKYFGGNLDMTSCDVSSITSLESALASSVVSYVEDVSKFTNVVSLAGMCERCLYLESTSCTFPSTVYSCAYMFAGAKSRFIGYIDANNCVNFRGMFSNSEFTDAPDIRFKHYITKVSEDFINPDIMFRGATNLTSIPEYDASGWYFTDNGFLGYPSDTFTYSRLTHIGGFKDLGFNARPGVTLFLGKCPSLNNQSVQNIISKVYYDPEYPRYGTIVFHSDVYDNITEDQFALAASKKWFIERYIND